MTDKYILREVIQMSNTLTKPYSKVEENKS